MAEVTQPSRSEREAHIKDKAGWVITLLAALLAINTLIGGANSSKILSNTIAANDVWAFYQAKSIKQSLAEQSLYDAQRIGDRARTADMIAKINRYENDPIEGKVALLSRAHKLEADRDLAKQRSPWIGYASTAYQMAIVLLSASILAVSMGLFWSSFLVAGIGILLSTQGVLLWF